MTLLDLWQLAKTPMAAPESTALKRMRFVWMLLCLLLTLTVGQLSLLQALLGNKAALVPLLLIVAVALLGWRYFRLKRIADDRWLYEERP